MTWIAASLAEQRMQLGEFLLGTGGIGGIGGLTGPGIGLAEHDGLQLIDRAVKEGVRVLDTADAYSAGESERVVGVWASAHRDSDVLIQTKTGATGKGPDLSPERVERQLTHSIAVIGRVDLFLAHVTDPSTPWSASLPVFSRAVEDGRIRAYGLSNVDGPGLTSALETADRLGLVRPELIQNSFSLLVRGDEHEVLPIVRSEGLAYMAYSPLATGLLAGRYSNGEKPGRGDRASAASRADQQLADPRVVGSIREFDKYAASIEVSAAGLALSWVLNHPSVTAPIVGPSKATQWASIHEAVDIEWTNEYSTALDRIFTPSA